MKFASRPGTRVLLDGLLDARSQPEPRLGRLHQTEAVHDPPRRRPVDGHGQEGHGSDHKEEDETDLLSVVVIFVVIGVSAQLAVHVHR